MKNNKFKIQYFLDTSKMTNCSYMEKVYHKLTNAHGINIVTTGK